MIRSTRRHSFGKPKDKPAGHAQLNIRTMNRAWQRFLIKLQSRSYKFFSQKSFLLMRIAGDFRTRTSHQKLKVGSFISLLHLLNIQTCITPVGYGFGRRPVLFAFIQFFFRHIQMYSPARPVTTNKPRQPK